MTAHLAKLVPAAFVAWVCAVGAVILPITANAFWPIAVAPAVAEGAVRFTSDALSPLPNEGGEWVVQPWLPALAMWGTWEGAGFTGLGALAAALGAALGLLLYRVARRFAGPLPAMVAALLVAPLLMPLTLGSQLFALVVAATLYLALACRPWWWAAPLLLAMWANVHGSFVYGLGLCVLAAVGMLRLPEAAGEDTRPPIARASWPMRGGWLAACGLAVLATPLGLDVLEYVRDVQSVPDLGALTPLWRPLGPGPMAAYVVVLVLVVVAAAWRGRAEAGAMRSFLPVLPVLVLLAASFDAARQLVWLGLVLLPDLARACERVWLLRRWPADLRSTIVAVTAAVLLAGFAIALMPGLPLQRDFARNGLPTQRLLADVEQGDLVFASIEWADYIHVRTGASVYVDARLERYRPADLRRYRAIAGGTLPIECVRPLNRAVFVLREDSSQRLVDAIERRTGEHARDGGIVAYADCRGSLADTIDFIGRRD